MRIRTIKPEFWSHPILSKLADSTRLAAIGLLSISDDEGYFVAEPGYIRSCLWPFAERSATIQGAIVELSRHGYIEVRNHPERGAVGRVVNFQKHQVVDRAKPSKIKPYFDSVNDRRSIDDQSTLEQGTGNREQGAREAHSPDEIPAGEIPTVEEVIEAGKLSGVPELYCRHYHQQKEIKRMWLNFHGDLINWRKEMMVWFANDRHKCNPDGSFIARGSSSSSSSEEPLSLIPELRANQIEYRRQLAAAKKANREKMERTERGENV